MIKKLIATILTLFLILPSLPNMVDLAHAESGKVTISVSTLNVRKGPGLSYPVVTKVHSGEQFNVVDSKNEWYKIQTGSVDGWVANWLVTRVSSASPQSSEKSGTVSANGLRVRQGPSTSDGIVSVLYKGDKVTITNQKGSWLSIEAGNIKGWVHQDYVSQTLSNSPSAPVKNTESKQGIITVSSLNVRESPSLSSTVLGVVHKGTRVDLTGSISGWYEIKFGTKKAWISDKYVEDSSSSSGSESSASVQQSLVGTITVYSLNVRDKASLNGNVVGKVSKGEKYTILKEENNWYQISFSNGNSGWVAGWFVQKTVEAPPQENSSQSHSNERVTILYNGTNIRSESNVQSRVVKRANSGETFQVMGKSGDWYEIKLENGSLAFVAGWIVSIQSNTGSTTNPSPTSKSGIRNKVIVIDPGHGGRDGGTTGARGTLEKILTMRTGELIADKLKSAGATVILTRKNDEYVSLNSRVSLSHYYNADAFVSLHYDSIYDSSVAGHTTYYYQNYQRDLAVDVNESLANRLPTRDRGVKVGNYHVIRENKQKAVLLELGFLSNPTEEANVNSLYFQDLAATAIYQGLSNYFSN
ncbi:SH3 domain-containing protein [Rossellomorea aquimaris]|uniref:SH3 domain-containing protein n=1 Tax=Rossellomorea aquimaris TaxID=189382 RepID=UPI0007D098F1|nr:SH3 domain-containing protein [Rossellomorea aquimaris]